ncbi:hypothetical protein E5676_scaffold392G00230 [Cucumis melo var. makuwa]|uniref:Uncharacterized protein n=1 Tax=Cucumis melo var. makuwa TaxID=1194695 RepID=A0A5D3DBP3_CUCMM|nr:hypothetical protein E6C27_scaffold238G001060 [Cucumis melo var. makuwa]TYK21061.1 hypothetical protein E5676_scaffold392G00230 [Cucumis melo var. makuwa]
MPRREWGRAGSRSHTMTKHIMDLGAHSVNQYATREMEENLYYRVALRLIDRLTNNLEKKFSVERLKALGATTVEETTNQLMWRSD